MLWLELCFVAFNLNSKLKPTKIKSANHFPLTFLCTFKTSCSEGKQPICSIWTKEEGIFFIRLEKKITEEDKAILSHVEKAQKVKCFATGLMSIYTIGSVY